MNRTRPKFTDFNIFKEYYMGLQYDFNVIKYPNCVLNIIEICKNN